MGFQAVVYEKTNKRTTHVIVANLSDLQQLKSTTCASWLVRTQIRAASEGESNAVKAHTFSSSMAKLTIPTAASRSQDEPHNPRSKSQQLNKQHKTELSAMVKEEVKNRSKLRSRV